MLIPLSTLAATTLAIASVVVPCFIATLTGFMVNQRRLSLAGAVAGTSAWAISLIAGVGYAITLATHTTAPADALLGLLLVIGVLASIVAVALTAIWMSIQLYEAMERGVFCRFSMPRH